MSRRKSNKEGSIINLSNVEILPASKSKGRPKFRDPENPFNTWSGESRRPKWLNRQLEKGLKLEDMLIPGETLPVKTVRYADPENPENTWSGLGRRPKWLQEKIRNGSSLDDFKVG